MAEAENSHIGSLLSPAVKGVGTPTLRSDVSSNKVMSRFMIMIGVVCVTVVIASKR